MPVITVIFSIAGLASLGLPGTSGFIAEFITFIGCFSSTAVAGIQIYTILGVFGVVLTAGYILYMLQKVFYGPPQDKFNGLTDANIVDKICIFAFTGVILLIGLYPALLTQIIEMGIVPVAKMIGL